jgi:Uma2 family endonuclease
MSSAAPKLRLATVEDLLAIPEHDRFHEIVDGELVRKAMPSGPHSTAQAELVAEVAGAYGLRPRGRGPGGWRIMTEPEIRFEEHQIFRPDVAGWHRERLPAVPKELPIRTLPDWVCEILSPSNPQNDLIKKARVYHRCQVPHYWIIDPIALTLTVYRWSAEGYVFIQSAEGRERICPEPFAAIEISVQGLIEGDEGDEGAPTTPSR